MNVMIVETPAKGRTLAPLLGKDWRVEACYGPLRDFPEDELGIDVARDFRPIFRLLPGAGGRLRKLAQVMQEADVVYFATRPDAEGEALAGQLLELVNLPPDKPTYRLHLPTLTPTTLSEALEHPRQIDLNRVEAYTTRLIVDRLFSHLVAPLADRMLDGKYPLDRLACVALRLIAERDTAAKLSYATIHAHFDTTDGDFDALLTTQKLGQARLNVPNQAEKLRDVLTQAHYQVAKTAQTVRPRPPLPPFTPITLLQAAAGELGLTAAQTRALAHSLYDHGAITFPETAATRVTPKAVMATRDFIRQTYGDAYLPHESSSEGVEIAEAIRPTDVNRLPETVTGDGAALYKLIWQRFIAAHMAPARYRLRGALIHAGKTPDQPYPVFFRVQDHRLEFDGFLRAYSELKPEADTTPSPFDVLAHLHTGQALMLPDLRVERHDAPTSAYTEATLLTELASRGIPISDASARLVASGYVVAEVGQLRLTEMGRRLHAYLEAYFADVLTDDFTARLHADFDRIAQGETERLTAVRGYWATLQPDIIRATEALVGAQHTSMTPVTEERHDRDT
ncbi:MAG: hypothetical protein IAE80_18345 [Anaerolinea sp.]|nr:hypothetical protein [Anaerolinea sp.]